MNGVNNLVALVARSGRQKDYIVIPTKASTVKLGYNDHGYNELTVITNNFNPLVWLSIFYQVRYNRVRLYM